MASVGKKAWPAMRALVLLLIERGHPHRSSAGGRHAIESVGGGRSEHNDTFGAPGSSASRRGIGQHLQCPARRLNSLQLRVGEEPDTAAVGGPERQHCAFGSRQWLGGERAQRTYPQLGLAAGIRGGKSQLATVWRHGQVKRFEGTLLGREDGNPYRRPRTGRTGCPGYGESDRGQQAYRRRRPSHIL